MKISIGDDNAQGMKKLFWIIGCLALSGAGCNGGDDEGPLSGENRIVAFSLESGGDVYDATIEDDRITIRAPYNRSLANASARMELSEAAAVRPDPATIADWDQEWLFLVTSADGRNDRSYRYSVERTDIAAAGDLTLRTQQEVDAFATKGYNVVEGDLVIGVAGSGEPIENLDGLAALKQVRGALVVTDAYVGKDLAGLENLTACGPIAIGRAEAPHPVLRSLDLRSLEEVAGDLGIFGASLRTVCFDALRQVAGSVHVRSAQLTEFMSDGLTTIKGDLTLCGTLSDEAADTAPCNQLFLPALARVGGTITLARFDRLSGLATSFGALTAAGGVRYEHLAMANTFEFPQLETAGAVLLDDCPLLRSISLPQLVAAAAFCVRGCPAVGTTDLSALERIDGDVSLHTLPGIGDFGALFPRLAAVGGDLTLDDLPSLAGTVDLSRCTFAADATVTFRFVSAPKIDAIRGGNFGGSLTLDASPLTLQPAAMPFGIDGFRDIGALRIVGFTQLGLLSLPVVRCRDLIVENCGSQAPFALSLPALAEVSGSLVLRNCGKPGAENRASFPVLKNVGRQLALYVRGAAFAALELPALETVGDGVPLSDDPSGDYAFYTMPSGCDGAFVLPRLRRVTGNMLVSTFNASTDRTSSFEFPALETVTGALFIGHDRYPNRSVRSLDFRSLVEAGSVYIGNLGSVEDFSTFRGVLPRLSAGTWRVEKCGANPTYEQMTGAGDPAER